MTASPTGAKSLCSDSDSPVVHRQNKPGLSALRHKLSQSFRKSRTSEVELDDSNAYGKESCLECRNVCMLFVYIYSIRAKNIQMFTFKNRTWLYFDLSRGVKDGGLVEIQSKNPHTCSLLLQYRRVCSKQIVSIT